ncbi:MULTISPECIES: substrate-binding periplasmic protein [Mesorhizobium]|uniref:Amino acid ABC transporter substrate-binding protein n=1 Tax=Mesorhizobium denitrificans TaxID=2294114 RepID=A0A371XEI5_9HYPH|nr:MULTISPECIES: transporter substrate-binding domain-containing protein [Mesorhizobium]RFC67649.1 amino acid ABC transporter substrate-binding protein [Mesorhizobium denitrificans]
MAKLRLLASAALIAVSTGAYAQDCKPAHEFKTVTPGKLTMAIYNYPPFTMITSDNKASGIDDEMIKLTAKANCLEVVPLNLAPAAVVQSVISGKADVAVGAWYRSEERSKVLGVTLPTYIDPMTSISKDGVDTVDGMMGKSVGTVQGYTWNGTLQKVFGTNLKLYPDGLAMYTDLEAGRLDVALDGSVAPVEAMKGGRLVGFKTALVKSDERIPDTVQPPQSTILYTFGNKGLGEALDETVTKVHEDGSLAKWLTDAGYDPKMGDVGEPRFVK